VTDPAGLRAVVVGTGFGCVTHVRALRAAGFDVLAVVGRDEARTKRRAAMFGVSHACGTLAEALALGDVAAVTIATPPHTHRELVLEAISAGKHVLCEKPLARDRAEAMSMLVAAESAGVVHFLGTEFRFDAGQATLARAIAAGLVGVPKMASVILNVPMLADPTAEVPTWWADAEAGGGWLGAHGSQIIDQLRVTLGEFAAVSASLTSIAGAAMTAENAFVVQFEMRSGAVGVLQSSAADWGPPIIVTRIAGTDGTAWIEGVGSTVRVADRDGIRTVPIEGDLPTGAADPLPDGALENAYQTMTAHGLDFAPYRRLTELFAARIRGSDIPPDPMPATFVDGVAAMSVLDAIRVSAAERRWVAVSEEPGCAQPAQS
jgi:predicted dehydrogenase